MKKEIRTKLFLLVLRLKCFLKGVNLVLGRRIVVEENVKVCCSRGSSLLIGDGVKLSEFLRIFVFEGAEVVLKTTPGVNCHINCVKKIVVGEKVLFGAQVSLIDSRHRTSSGALFIEQECFGEDIVVESNSWLGFGCMLLPGVTVRSGSVVGAGAVVTKSFPCNSVIGGVPAQELKKQ